MYYHFKMEGMGHSEEIKDQSKNKTQQEKYQILYTKGSVLDFHFIGLRSFCPYSFFRYFSLLHQLHFLYVAHLPWQMSHGTSNSIFGSSMQPRFHHNSFKKLPLMVFRQKCHMLPVLSSFSEHVGYLGAGIWNRKTLLTYKSFFFIKVGSLA